jgi:hypothetical protein
VTLSESVETYLGQHDVHPVTIEKLTPAEVGVDNPVRRHKEQHSFESRAELEALAAAIDPRYGPMTLSSPRGIESRVRFRREGSIRRIAIVVS